MGVIKGDARSLDYSSHGFAQVFIGLITCGGVFINAETWACLLPGACGGLGKQIPVHSNTHIRSPTLRNW